MAKRVDHDSTMEVSSSQLVPEGQKRPVPQRPPGGDRNDMSMWIGGVVGADAFAGTPKPKRRWGLLVVVLIFAMAGGAFGYYLLAAKHPASTPGVLPADAAIAPQTADAAPAAVALIDAGADAAVDAGAEAALKVDAVTGVDATKPPAKKVTKKVVKKPAVKKKPAPRHR